MNTDQVLIQFVNVEQVAQAWGQEAQTLGDVLQRLRSATDTLLSSGIQGDYVRVYQNRCADLEQTLQQSGSRVNQVGQALTWTASAFRELDQQGTAAFGNADSAASYLNPLQPGQIDPRALMYLGMVGAIGGLYGLIGSGLSAAGAGDGSYSLYTRLGDLDTMLDLDLKKDLGKDLFQALTGINSAIGGSVIGGLLDFAVDPNPDPKHGGLPLLGGDVVTSVLLGLGGDLVPGVGTALIINSAVQLAGHLGAEFISANAGWLSNGDPAFANQIQETATKFESDLSNANPTSLIRNEITDIFSGNTSQMGTDASQFLQGVGGTLTNGVSLASDTIEGAASNLLGIPVNTIQQTVNQDVGQALDSVERLFAW